MGRSVSRQVRALAAVDLDKPMPAVRELRRRVENDGFVGLRMVPWLWGAPPTDRRYYPLFAACVELEVPFCTGRCTGSAAGSPRAAAAPCDRPESSRRLRMADATSLWDARGQRPGHATVAVYPRD